MDGLKKIFSSKIWIYILGLLFLFNYILLNYFVVENKQFNSPDEMATVYFLEKYSNGNFEEKFIDYKSVHPRSILLWQEEKVPVAFVGYLYLLLPVYKLFSLWGIYIFIFLLFAVFAYLFYKVLAKVQSQKLALLSSVLLLFNPAFFYYLNKALYHNVLFLLLALIAFFLFWLAEKKWQYFGALIMALAFWLRPVEIIWLLPLLFWTWSYLAWPWMKRILFLFISGTISLFLFLFSNYLIYGNPYLFGYVLPNESQSFINDSVLWGIDFKQIFFNVRDFAFSLFWPWAWLLLLALIVIVLTWQRQNKFIKWNCGALLIVSSVLFIYYGSWHLNEHIVPGTISIGNSFVRYWLPIYILAIPLIAYFLLLLWKLKLKLFSFVLTIFLIVWSLYSVLFAHDDSLLAVNKNIQTYVSQREYLANILTTENTVLIVDRDDKFLFPYYEVIHLPAFQGEEALLDIKNLLQSKVAVYYYGFTIKEDDLFRLNDEVFKNYNYKLEVYLLEDERSIYKFISYDEFTE